MNKFGWYIHKICIIVKISIKDKKYNINMNQQKIHQRIIYTISFVLAKTYYIHINKTTTHFFQFKIVKY